MLGSSGHLNGTALQLLSKPTHTAPLTHQSKMSAPVRYSSVSILSHSPL